MAAGASNFGAPRSTDFEEVFRFSLAHSEASLKLSRSHTAQVGTEGEQQRQQQRTSGDDEPVTEV